MLLSSTLLFFVVSILIAVTAVVYSYVLIQPGEIFSGIYRRLDVFFKTDERQAEGLGIHPIFKMIMWCEKCVAGQISFWSYLIFVWPWYRCGYFALIFTHILFVAFTIFLTLCVKKFYKTKIE